MDITALLARIAPANGANAASDSASGASPLFTRTLEAAVAAAARAQLPQSDAQLETTPLSQSLTADSRPATATLPDALRLALLGAASGRELETGDEALDSDSDSEDTVEMTAQADTAPVPLVAAAPQQTAQVKSAGGDALLPPTDTATAVVSGHADAPATAGTTASPTEKLATAQPPVAPAPAADSAAATGRAEHSTHAAAAETVATAADPQQALSAPAVTTSVADSAQGGAPATVPFTISAPTPPSSPAVAAAATSAPIALQTPVTNEAWPRELGQQLVDMVQRGSDRIDLHLHPRELGPLSVSLQLDDRGASAHFFSAHAAVRSAVEQAVPQLRDALAQQGIALGEANVGEQQQQQAQRQFSGERATSGSAGDIASGAESDADARPLVSAGNSNLRGVDLYA